MSATFVRRLFVLLPWLVIGGAVVVAAVPALRVRALSGLAAYLPAPKDPHDDHAGHDYGSTDSIELSEQARKNIGLTLGRITPTTHERTIAIPGMFVERPGRSTLQITAPLTGIVTEILPIQGEAVQSEQKLFELQLTHEELVQAQGDFLRVAEELGVIDAEIARLQKIAAEGGIPNRQVIERQYERQNKLAVLRAQEQALLLHGLSKTQAAEILKSRELLRQLTVSVPAETSAKPGEEPPKRTYEIKELRVTRGQSVTAGETLAVLADPADLFIEGNAFDKDVASVNRAIERGWSVKAVLETDDAKPEVINELKILYMAGSVDAESRTFHFYLPLRNPQVRDVTPEAGHRFLSWKYKPGQRVQLIVPVETWEKKLVLPAEAVAQDGVETYVFVPNGKRMDRKPVHVEYRDRFQVVIADDGSVFPGDMVALSGAQQMLLALKNKAGGAVDPHAGHNH
jgi:multidrug efflux pump subunit AcrA (membrane-fusion protein)